MKTAKTKNILLMCVHIFILIYLILLAYGRIQREVCAPFNFENKAYEYSFYPKNFYDNIEKEAIRQKIDEFLINKNGNKLLVYEYPNAMALGIYDADKYYLKRYDLDFDQYVYYNGKIKRFSYENYLEDLYNIESNLKLIACDTEDFFLNNIFLEKSSVRKIIPNRIFTEKQVINFSENINKYYDIEEKEYEGWDFTNINFYLIFIKYFLTMLCFLFIVSLPYYISLDKEIYKKNYIILKLSFLLLAICLLIISVGNLKSSFNIYRVLILTIFTYCIDIFFCKNFIKFKSKIAKKERILKLIVVFLITHILLLNLFSPQVLYNLKTYKYMNKAFYKNNEKVLNFRSFYDNYSNGILSQRDEKDLKYIINNGGYFLYGASKEIKFINGEDKLLPILVTNKFEDSFYYKHGIFKLGKTIKRYSDGHLIEPNKNILIKDLKNISINNRPVLLDNKEFLILNFKDFYKLYKGEIDLFNLSLNFAYEGYKNNGLDKIRNLFKSHDYFIIPLKIYPDNSYNYEMTAYNIFFLFINLIYIYGYSDLIFKRKAREKLKKA